MPTLYLIDGHAQFFRAYHAIRTAMSSPVTGEPTNLVYGFVGMLLKLLKDYGPEYLAVVIDVSGDRESFRSQLDPQYKANRESAPDDFHPQVERCVSLLQEMGVPVLGQEGVEADDVIATLARRLRRERPDLNIRIISRDKDLTQLVEDGVEMLDPHKDELVTPSSIFKTEGVEPKHVVEILALMGDTSDNIPGVPGIGPKTAAKLLLEHGSIESIYDNIESIKGKRRENLEASRERVPLNIELVTLKDDLDVDFDVESAKVDFASHPLDEALASFRALGFGRHADELKSLAGGEGADRGEALTPAGTTPAAPPHQDDDQGLLFGDAQAAPLALRDTGSAEIIRTRDALDALVVRARAAGLVAIDTETTGLAVMSVDLCGVSMAIDPREGFYIPTRSPEADAHLGTDEVIEALRPLLEDEQVTLIGHNLKFDLNILRRHGARLRARLFDTMIASYVVDATRSSHKLDVLAMAFLGHAPTPIADLIGKGRTQKTFDQVPLEHAAPYAAEDADMTRRLHDVLAEQMDEQGLRHLFDTVEMPLVPVLADLEYAGIHVDRAELERQREALAGRIDELRRAILESAPHPFNPDSPKQLAVALFNTPEQEPPGLGLPILKRGKTGPSTDVEVLEKLALDPDVTSPVPDLIIEHRQLTKLVSTYLVSLADDINPETGRVHASFNQTVAATGRLSSSDPNLQNIPIRTEVGREIRRAFTADPGNILLTADYSQIELRLLAHLAKDPALVEAFRKGLDIHTAVAAEVHGIDPADVTSEQRSGAKMVNFGIIYGITPFGLSRRLGPDTSVEDAKAIIDRYKARFTRIDAFLHECVETAKSKGYVETILGRRRAIPQAGARHPQQRALGERMAINTVVQGSAADLIKVAMINLHRVLPDERPAATMVLQIHDELVFEAPEPEAEALQSIVVREMTGAMNLDVELVVESGWSSSWIDVK
ncbi:MAG: DNA polymerase I [Planctomycetota bacterium]|jgi:DNA polymerase-1